MKLQLKINRINTCIKNSFKNILNNKKLYEVFSLIIFLSLLILYKKMKLKKKRI